MKKHLQKLANKIINKIDRNLIDKNPEAALYWCMIGLQLDWFASLFRIELY